MNADVVQIYETEVSEKQLLRTCKYQSEQSRRYRRITPHSLENSVRIILDIVHGELHRINSLGHQYPARDPPVGHVQDAQYDREHARSVTAIPE
jgi:hypothetical protein